MHRGSLGGGQNQPDTSDPAARRAAGLARGRELMLPAPQDLTPFVRTVINEIDRGSDVARKIQFNLSADSRVLALMLVPKARGPLPAALLLLDHGARFDIGKEKLVRPWGDAARETAAQDGSARYVSGRFPGDELARRGYLVLAVDALALGGGDRSVPGSGRESQQALAANLLNRGTSHAEIIAHEDLRAARFLASRPEVDPLRVAAFDWLNAQFCRP